MAQWENRVLLDLRVAGSNPAGQLLIYFRNVFLVLTKLQCRHTSLVPRSRIKTFVRKPGRCSPRPSDPLLLACGPSPSQDCITRNHILGPY